MIKESTQYESLINVVSQDAPSDLKEFLGDNTSLLEDLEKQKRLKDIAKQNVKMKRDSFTHFYKKIYVKFANEKDCIDFQKLTRCKIIDDNDVRYDCTKLLEENDDSLNHVYVKPTKRTQKTNSLSEFVDELEDSEDKMWKVHWHNMPEFSYRKNEPFKKITMKFYTEDDYKYFANVIGQELSNKTSNIWHPKLMKSDFITRRWVDDEFTLPRYPVYIISKGRHESMITSRSLSRMRIPHYIAIEPQDWDNYQKALDDFGIRKYVTLLELPFSNHGDGPGRARNWCWDHSISLGSKRHWVLDDNIGDFYRFHNNERVRVESGCIFRASEDFVDRYKNVPIAGFQYRFFIAPNSTYPAFVKNTRIYSCLLIENTCKHRWRGRYNEDTDICLRVLKDGDCTIQFNAFLQGKSATQTVKGGNTSEFYHAEYNENKEKWRDGHLNPDGTINKSKMLYDLHPDVTRIEFKYGRWHHYVDYNPFKKNELEYVDGYEPVNVVNEYNMVFDDNWSEEKYRE